MKNPWRVFKILLANPAHFPADGIIPGDSLLPSPVLKIIKGKDSHAFTPSGTLLRQ